MENLGILSKKKKKDFMCRKVYWINFFCYPYLWEAKVFRALLCCWRSLIQIIGINIYEENWKCELTQPALQWFFFFFFFAMPKAFRNSWARGWPCTTAVTWAAAVTTTLTHCTMRELYQWAHCNNGKGCNPWRNFATWY